MVDRSKPGEGTLSLDGRCIQDHNNGIILPDIHTEKACEETKRYYA